MPAIEPLCSSCTFASRDPSTGRLIATAALRVVLLSNHSDASVEPLGCRTVTRQSVPSSTSANAYCPLASVTERNDPTHTSLFRYPHTLAPPTGSPAGSVTRPKTVLFASGGCDANVTGVTAMPLPTSRLAAPIAQFAAAPAQSTVPTPDAMISRCTM